MMIKKILLIKYGEISLRKANRVIFERQIMNTIRARLGEDGVNGNFHVIREQGRILLEDMRGDINENAVIPKIKTIFGIIAICIGIKIPACDIGQLQNLAGSFFLQNLGTAASFKVETKRSEKKFPLTSQEISAAVGGQIKEQAPDLTVKLTNPEVTLRIEIRNHIYCYIQSVPAEGGLPYGSSGKGILLLSGGIDSPVAGYLTARRGVEIVPVYFHSPPYTSERVVDKVMDIAQKLAVYTDTLRLIIVPFTDTQLYLYEFVQAEKLTLLLKRAMLRIASQIAVTEKAHCLITGDSIGQVASQTILSLEAVHSAAAFPVLRPLSAMDKQQIIDMAQKIGTFPISIHPYEDCCTLFTAKHPESKPKASIIEKIETRLIRLPELITEALANTKVYTLGPEGVSCSSHAMDFQG
jgi:thiamine biosynthesis protein ThiI